MLAASTAFVCTVPFSTTPKRETARPRPAVTPYCAKSSKSSSSRRRKPRRPDSADSAKPAPPGFARAQDAAAPQELTTAAPSEAEAAPAPSKADNLKTPDANGITLEHRLREEIQHPLRKPKQTLFATLAFSATIGLVFACGRFAAEKDSLAFVAKNIAIDIAAISLFAFLTWREFEFGRRSLNSIAGRPEPRDLYVDGAKSGRAKRRVSSLLNDSDVLIAAGRQVDLHRYFDRCNQSSDEWTDVAIVALPMNAEQNGGDAPGSESVLAADGESMDDWIAWLGDAVPPRRNVALFRLEKRENATLPASAYVVAVEDPRSLPLADKARRPKVVDV